MSPIRRNLPLLVAVLAAGTSCAARAIGWYGTSGPSGSTARRDPSPRDDWLGDSAPACSLSTGSDDLG